jgi:excisionase family DNA binding protein
MQTGFAKVQEAAKFLSVSRATMYRLIDDGVVDVRRFGRTVRVPWSWLHDQARNRKAEPEPEIVYGRLRTRVDEANQQSVHAAR